jgi:putative ABC transport system ATP-binding protein
VIELRNVTKIFRSKRRLVIALDDVTVRISRGEFVTIQGPSGSGKTTLLNIIGCLDGVTTGRYFLDGDQLSGSSDTFLSQLRNRVFSFVFQQFSLVDELTVAQNVAMPLIYRGERAPVALAAADRALDTVGLGDLGGALPNDLSGGQQQRVAIARAIVAEASVILADEPTGSLDPAAADNVLRILESRHAAGTTVILVTHDPSIAKRGARTIEMEHGHIR